MDFDSKISFLALVLCPMYGTKSVANALFQQFTLSHVEQEALFWNSNEIC